MVRTSRIAFTASWVTGMIGERNTRNSDASSLFVPMISGTRCERPCWKRSLGYAGSTSPSTTGAAARRPGSRVGTSSSRIPAPAMKRSTPTGSMSSRTNSTGCSSSGRR